MTWKQQLPARIRRMSKRRQQTGLYRYIKRGIERALHQGYSGHIVTEDMRARMVESIKEQLRLLPPPIEYIRIDVKVLSYQDDSKESLPRSPINS